MVSLPQSHLPLGVSMYAKSLLLTFFACTLLLFSCSKKSDLTPPPTYPYQDLIEQHVATLPYRTVHRSPLLVMFVATPGMGKTTVAKKLAHRLQGLYISSDVVRWRLRSVGVFPESRYNFGLRPIDAYAESVLRYIRERSDNNLVVMDANIGRTFDRYLRFAEKYGYRTYIIRLAATPNQIRERILRELPHLEAEKYFRYMDRWLDDYQVSKKHPQIDYHQNLYQSLESVIDDVGDALEKQL